jgi:hypothetical protein
MIGADAMKRSADLAIVCITVLLAIHMLRAPAEQAPGPDVAPEAIPVEAWLTALSAQPLLLGQADLPSTDRLRAGGDGPFDGPVPPLATELIDTSIEVAADLDENLAAKLSELRRKNPQEFSRRLVSSRRLLELARLKLRDPGLYKVKLFELETDAKVSRLAIEYCRARRHGEKEELPRLRSELQQQVMFQVGSTLRARADYICRLEDEVLRLDAKLKEDMSAFNGLVTARLDHLLKCAERQQAVPPGGLSPEAQRATPDIPEE